MSYGLSEKTIAKYVRSVAVLSLPSGDQIKWLEGLGLGTSASCDELALEFGDAHLHLNLFVDSGVIPATAVPALNALDERLVAMSGSENANLWTIDALTAREEWSQVRSLAARCLLALD